MRSILSPRDRRATDHTSNDIVVPASDERSSFSLQSENTFVPCLVHAAAPPTSPHGFLRSSTGGAATRFLLCSAPACSYQASMHAYGPWQPYSHDTCGPLVALTVLA
jgi:hypothetical protein